MGELALSTFDATAAALSGEVRLRGSSDVPGLWTRLLQSRSGQAVAGGLSALGLAAAGCSTGESTNDSTTAPATTVAVSPEDRLDTAVYYQPRKSDLHYPESLNVSEFAMSTVYTMTAEPGERHSWTSAAGKKNCNPENADNFLDNEKTKKAHTLAGFSLGRVGVSYFMQQATPEQQAGINTIVLVAPGNKEDFTDSCDPADTSALMDRWLQMDEDNHLVIVADNRTAEQDFTGIRELYLDGLTPGVTDQVAVCATRLGHEETWNNVKTEIFAKPAIESCSADEIPYDDWRQ